MKFREWSTKDDSILRSHYTFNSVKRIGCMLKRRVGDVRNRANILNLGNEYQPSKPRVENPFYRLFK